MSWKSDDEIFGCVKDFRRLGNGRHRKAVIIGDHSDARVGELLSRTFVKRNWPSQRRTKHKLGYIELGSGQIFDIANQTIEGRPVYIFLLHDRLEILWRKQIAKNTICDWMKRSGDKDVIALGQLVAESTVFGPPYPFRFLAEELVRDCMEALSLLQLEEFAALVLASCNLEDSNVARKAA